MPLKLNVGASRKIGEPNYGSRGASVHVEVELDAALIRKPFKLHKHIRQLFAIVGGAVAEELSGRKDSPAQATANQAHHHAAASANGKANRLNGAGNVQPRLATIPQVKAILTLASTHQVDLTALLQARFQVDKPEHLTVSQASDIIGTLKAPINPGD
jgi:hypothetical protein